MTISIQSPSKLSSKNSGRKEIPVEPCRRFDRAGDEAEGKRVGPPKDSAKVPAESGNAEHDYEVDAALADLVDDDAAGAVHPTAAPGEPHAPVAARVQVAGGVAGAHDGPRRYVSPLWDCLRSD